MVRKKHGALEKNIIPVESYSSAKGITERYHTLVVIDIVQSTSLMSKLEIEDAKALYDKFIITVETLLQYYQGEVLETTGDGAILLFKGSWSPLQVCGFSLKLPKKLHEKNIGVKVRIGAHYFNNHFNNRDELMNSADTSIPDLLQKVAAIDNLALSHATYQAIRSYINVQHNGHIAINIDKSIANYRLLGITQKGEQLLEKISREIKCISSLKNKVEYIGERKYLTVFFIQYRNDADIKNEIVTVIEEEIAKNKGSVVKVMNNSILALFGHPIPSEFHAINACLTGYQLKNYFSKNSHLGYVKIGINSGEIIVDTIGVTLRGNFDILGIDVNLAARLMETAKRNRIQCSTNTLSLTRDFILYNALDKKELKGIPGLVEVYEVEKVSAKNLHSQMHGKLYEKSNFINHKDELSFFEDKFINKEQSFYKILTFCADAGFGKSRLTYELTKIAEKSHYTVVDTISSNFEKEVVFSTLKTLLVKLLDIDFSNDFNIKESICSFCEKYEEIEPSPFLFLFDQETSNSEWQGMDPKLQKLALFDSIGFIIENLTFCDSHILIFEDMQWCDYQSLDFIEYVSKRFLDNCNVLFIFNYRPSFSLPETLKKISKEIKLSPLSKGDSMKMMESILSKGNICLNKVCEKIYSITEGIPFFIEEYMKIIKSKENKIGNLKKNRLNLIDYTRNLPGSIHAIIYEKIGMLSHNEKIIIQQASILGNKFKHIFLKVINEMSEDVFLRELQSLIEKEFLVQVGFYPEIEYEFNHSYVREVIYNTTLIVDRKTYHKRFFVELQKSKFYNKDFYLLSKHAYAAAEWIEAIKSYDEFLQSGVSLKQSVDDILSISKLVKYCFNKSPDKDKITIFPHYARVVLLEMYGYWQTSEMALANDVAVELRKEAQLYGYEFFVFLIDAWQIIPYCMTGQAHQYYEKGQDIYNKIEKIEQSYSDLNLQDFKLIVYLALQQTMWPLGKYAEFDRVTQLGLKESKDIFYTSYYIGNAPVTSLNIHNVWCQCARGNTNSIKPYIEDLEGKVGEMASSEVKLIILIQIVIYNFTVGNLDKCQQFIKDSSQLGDLLEHGVCKTIISPYETALLYFTKDIKGSIEAGKQSIELYKTINYTMASWNIVLNIEILVLNGQCQYALDVLETILELSVKNKEKPLQAQCYRVKALALIYQSKLTTPNIEVVNLLEKARLLTEELGCYTQKPYIDITYSLYYHKLGNHEQATTYLESAILLFNSYGLAGWAKFFSSPSNLEQLID